jgi:FtsH-binding integral membrane protein
MTNLKQSQQFTGKKALLLALVLLPIGCLLWQWSILPTQVPLHFSRGGADSFGDKHVLIGLVLIPLMLYAGLPLLYRTEAENALRQQIVTGAILFLSLGLCVLLLAGIPLNR